MSIDNPKEHDYDWVSATEECSVACEFARLQDNARSSIDTRNLKINDSAEKFTLEVETESKFLVKSCSGHFVSLRPTPITSKFNALILVMTTKQLPTLCAASR